MDYNKPFDQTNPAAGYVNGNPATNTAGSIPCAEGLEFPQREIVAAITAAGLTPSNADLTQLLQAIGILARRQIIGVAPTIPTGDVTIHVSTAGNDATADGTTTKPFATIYAAALYASRRYFFAGYKLIVQLDVPGTYAAPGGLPALGGQVVVRGDPNNHGPYIVQGAGPAQGGGSLIAANNGCQVTTSGLTIVNTGTINGHIGAGLASSISFDNCEFLSTVATGQGIIIAAGGGSAICGAGNIINCYAGAALLATGGNILLASTLTVLNNPAFSAAFAVAINSGGSINVSQGVGIAGAAQGQRYSASLNASINTLGGGEQFFPGTGAGVKLTGGQYA